MLVQFTLMPSSYKGVEPICISGVTGSQALSALEAEISLTGNEWQKHPILSSSETACILDTDYLRVGYFRNPKGYCWLSVCSSCRWRTFISCSWLAQSFRGHFAKGLWEAGASCYSDSALMAVLHQLGLPDSHLYADSSTGETKSNQSQTLAHI